MANKKRLWKLDKMIYFSGFTKKHLAEGISTKENPMSPQMFSSRLNCEQEFTDEQKGKLAALLGKTVAELF